MHTFPCYNILFTGKYIYSNLEIVNVIVVGFCCSASHAIWLFSIFLQPQHNTVVLVLLANFFQTNKSILPEKNVSATDSLCYKFSLNEMLCHGLLYILEGWNQVLNINI